MGSVSRRCSSPWGYCRSPDGGQKYPNVSVTATVAVASVRRSLAGGREPDYAPRMNAHQYELAQINIGILRAPLDSPQIADFVAALEPINALADASPGFRW